MVVRMAECVIENKSKYGENLKIKDKINKYTVNSNYIKCKFNCISLHYLHKQVALWH